MRVIAFIALLVVEVLGSGAWGAGERPNVIFILADDLGYVDLGCYGGKVVRTPNIDRMAGEGVRFTQAYTGTSVCAPARCSLMTGLHMGHAWIRANREIKPEGQAPMPADTFTAAHLFKSAGYATACTGKWGLGHPGSVSTPNKMGFDFFYGYNCQARAHNYYPAELWRNDQREAIEANANGQRKAYSHDLIAEETLKWVRANHAKPFFLYWAETIPHGKFEPPDTAGYEGIESPKLRAFASMVGRMDRSVGRLLEVLKELKIDENTMIVLAGDNGPAGADLSPQNPFRGIKRSMYEGGIRVPGIVRWPAKVKGGQTSDQPWAFWDFLATAAEVTGANLPERVKTDGISIVPAMMGQEIKGREYLYWELHEGKSIQALRQGDWKVVKNGPMAKVELYDLKADPKEANDLAGEKPEVVEKLVGLMKGARVDSEMFPMRAGGKRVGE